jgi:hypothetical protein
MDPPLETIWVCCSITLYLILSFALSVGDSLSCQFKGLQGEIWTGHVNMLHCSLS